MRDDRVSPAQNCLLGIDVGTRRVGVALAYLDIRIPRPLMTIDGSDVTIAVEHIVRLVVEHRVSAVVAGWPRGLAGQITDQTRLVESFVGHLQAALDIPVHLQDEALTSQKAEAELDARRKPYVKGDIDALAATYILDDFLHDYQPGSWVALAASAEQVEPKSTIKTTPDKTAKTKSKGFPRG